MAGQYFGITLRFDISSFSVLPFLSTLVLSHPWPLLYNYNSPLISFPASILSPHRTCPHSSQNNPSKIFWSWPCPAQTPWWLPTTAGIRFKVMWCKALSDLVHADVSDPISHYSPHHCPLAVPQDHHMKGSTSNTGLGMFFSMQLPGWFLNLIHGSSAMLLLQGRPSSPS